MAASGRASGEAGEAGVDPAVAGAPRVGATEGRRGCGGDRLGRRGPPAMRGATGVSPPIWIGAGAGERGSGRGGGE